MSTTVTGSKRHLNINADEFAGDLNGTINTATTAATQSTSDNSTKVATTAFVKAQGYATGTIPTFSTVGAAFRDLGDVSVVSYVRVNADETLSYLNAAQFLSAIGGQASGTYSTATGVADNADVTPSWVPANDPSYLTSQTSHSDVLVDGDFTSQGFMKRGSSAGSYSIDTNTYSTATGVANNADVTPSWVPANDPSYLTSETSHSDVLVDGDFSSAGFMKTDGSGTYSIDTNTYITSQATDFVSKANGGTFDDSIAIADIIDGEFTALRLMNQKTYGAGTGTNETVRFAMGIAESGETFANREGFVTEISTADQSDSSNINVNFKVRDGGTITTYQTVTGADLSVAFAGTVTSNGTTLTGDQDISGIATNTTNIATNVTNIATNATAISNIPANPTDFVSKANGGTFSGNVTVPDLTVGGVTYGLYHGTTEDGYYFDDYGGNRNLSLFLKNQRADIIRYQAVDNFEYWNGSAWVADSSQEDNVKKLLDGRQDTHYNVPSTYYKFRFTTNQSSGWPTRANIGIQTSWSGSTWPGCQMLVEHYESSSWVLHATMEFGGQAGGSATALNSNDNGIDNWGLMFKADSALHDGQGSSTDTTRITIDFHGWSPSNSSYTTIPLQNIFITSNYAGTENTDYTNLLDHSRNLSLAGNIVMANGKTVDGVDISALPTSFFDGAYSSLSGTPSIPSISGLATETYVDTAESDAISAAATAGDARYNLVSGNLKVDSKKVMDLPSNSTQRGPFQPLATMIRGAGTAVYGDEDFNAGSNSVNVYNNQGGTGVVHTRETDQTTLNQVAPNSSGYVIKVVNNGNATSPGRGGFYQTISSSNNKTFVQVFQAKIPATYSIGYAENAQGTNNTSYFLTDTAGTGKFEWYVRVSHCGDSGSFSSGGHIYLSGGSAGDQFTWYLASSEIYNVTDAQAKKLRNLSVTNDLTVGGDITVTGDLTVNGATVTVDTTNLNVQDNNITLNYSSGDSSSSAANAGITIQDAVDASTNATMLWDATNDRFIFSHGVVSGSTVLTGDQDISGIATNTSSISTNTTNIATNVTNIATNVTNIATNATAISNIPAESYTQHESISEATTGLNNSGRTYIQDITLDSNGHVTGVATATETVTNTDTNKFLSAVGLTTQGQTGVTFQITNGTNVTTSIFGSNAFNSTAIPSGNQIIDWSTAGSEKVIHSEYYTNTVYTHPQYGTTDIDTSGSTIIDSIATNSTGHITAMGTRTLTLSDLGFTGNSAANVVANSTQSLINKTFTSCTLDFDSNVVSNVEVGNFKGSSIVFEAEGISNNDTDLCIPTSAAVKDYVDNNSSSANYYLDGISKTNNVLTFSVNGATNQTYEFGANAFNSTAIPSISGLATTGYVDTAESDAISTASADATSKADAALSSAQSYADTAEADAISAAATAAASLYVPNSGTTTIGGTKTITGSLILNDGVGSSPTMRFINGRETSGSSTPDEVSIFCNPTGKMKFQQKVFGGSNVVQATIDSSGLHVDNGLKVGTGATITTIEDNDSLGTSDTKLATQGNIKAYVDNAVSSAGGGTMSNFTIRDDGGNDHTIDQGEFIQFDGVNCAFDRVTNPTTNNTSTPVVMRVTVPKGITENDFLICGNDVADNDFIRINGSVVEGRSASQVLSDIGAQASGSYLTSQTSHADVVVDGDFGSEGLMKRGSSAGSYSIVTDDSSNWNTAYGWGDHSGAGYLTSVATANIGANAVTLAKIKNLAKGRIIVGNSSNVTSELSVGTVGHVLTVQTGSTLGWSAPSGGGSSYSLPTSSTSTLGGVKLGSDTQLTQSYNAGGAGSSNRTYPVQLNSSNQMGVSVPWSNSNTTYSAGDGIGLSGTTFSVSAGTGLTTDTNGLSLSTGDESNLGGFKIKHAHNSSVPTANNASTTAARTYGITKNGSDQLVVNVPWTSSGGQPASTVTSVSILSHANLMVGHDGTSSDGMYLDFNSTTEMYIKDNNTNTARVTILASNGNTTFSGEIAAGNFTSQSDRRIKKDIVDVSSDSALDTVMKTQGVRYHIKEENDEGVFPEKHKEKRKNGLKELGFIAQDLEEVLPELVVTAEDDSKSVDYMKMTVVLVEAMKEQQKQIEELKKLINGNT